MTTQQPTPLTQKQKNATSHLAALMITFAESFRTVPALSQLSSMLHPSMEQALTLAILERGFAIAHRLLHFVFAAGGVETTNSAEELFLHCAISSNPDDRAQICKLICDFRKNPQWRAIYSKLNRDLYCGQGLPDLNLPPVSLGVGLVNVIGINVAKLCAECARLAGLNSVVAFELNETRLTVDDTIQMVISQYPALNDEMPPLEIDQDDEKTSSAEQHSLQE